jgi:plastocyanin
MKMMKFLWALIGSGFLLCNSTALAATVTVQVFSDFFEPKDANIKVGDTVTWVRRSGTHDTVSETGLWRSQLGFSTFSFVFNTPGTYPYFCTPHRSVGMTGRIIVEAAANAAPTVSISSPNSGASFTAPGPVTVEATAADTDGTIAKVEFFAGTTLLGTDTASPFQVTVTNFTAGSYSLTAKATDNAGGTTTSAAVAITVNPPAPVERPLLGTVERLGGGQIRFNISRLPAGRAYRIESSSDLVTWAPLESGTAPGGTFAFTTSTTTVNTRFLRVAVP